MLPRSKGDWVVRHPLQIESIRRRLPESPRTDELLRQLQRFRENLDAVVYALSSRELANDRRQHLLDILQKYRAALEACLEDLGIGPRPTRADPLWHFHQLDPVARNHLAAILGVPEEPSFYEVLDIKAEEYLAQLRAFESITEEDGFRERDRLSRSTRRGALVLTLSGSLIQISAPDGDGGRRYLYQNIYGNAHPPQGVLVLDRDIVVGHRIRSVELTTSPVRLLRIARRRMSWKAQNRTFQRLSHTFTSLANSSSSGGEHNRGPGLFDVRSRRFNPSAAERVLRQEYGEAFERFDTLRKAFADESDSQRIEAELLTLCHYLQTGARELGFDARPLYEVAEFVTADGRSYTVDAAQQAVVAEGTADNPEVVYAFVSVGRQLITCRAPLALISSNGNLLELIGPVAKLKPKGG